jgi:hypothetical protein
MVPLSMYSGALYPLHENILIIEHRKWNVAKVKKMFIVLVNSLQCKKAVCSFGL